MGAFKQLDIELQELFPASLINDKMKCDTLRWKLDKKGNFLSINGLPIAKPVKRSQLKKELQSIYSESKFVIDDSPKPELYLETETIKMRVVK